MRFEANYTEWQARVIAEALKDKAEQLPVEDVECRLNLSLLQIDFLEHARAAREADIAAKLQEHQV